MKFSSTRGGVNDVSLEKCLFMGSAMDGGVFLPNEIPCVSAETIKKWSTFDYIDIVKEVLALFLTEGDIPRTDLNQVVDKAMARLTHRTIVPLKKMKNGLNVLECFHGPSLSFKDLGMVIVGQAFSYFLEKQKKHVNIFITTTGDIGSSAIEVFRGFELVDLIVALPKGRISRAQELQMTTVTEDNIHVYRVDGSDDSIGDKVEAMYTDETFIEENNFCSLNNNIVRLLAQIPYYFYGYFQVCPDIDKTVEFVVPCGGFSNSTAAAIAKMMGLPITVVMANNNNDAVAKAITQGEFTRGPEVIPTLAPSMDVQVPFNMERIICVLSNMDRDYVGRLMTSYDKLGAAKLSSKLNLEIKSFMTTSTSSDEVILDTMKRCFEENNYVICPHTATAVDYHYTNQNRCPTNLQICIATASPAKFNETVAKAGLPFQTDPILQDIELKPTRFIDLEQGQDWENIIRTKVKCLTSAWEKRKKTANLPGLWKPLSKRQ